MSDICTVTCNRHSMPFEAISRLGFVIRKEAFALTYGIIEFLVFFNSCIIASEILFP